MVARLKALEESAAPLVSFLQNPAAVQELRADKQYNLQMLNDRYQVEFMVLDLHLMLVVVVLGSNFSLLLLISDDCHLG